MSSLPVPEPTPLKIPPPHAPATPMACETISAAESALTWIVPPAVTVARSITACTSAVIVFLAAAAPAATPEVAMLTCPAPDPIFERSVAITLTSPPVVTAAGLASVPVIAAETVCAISLITSDVPTPALVETSPPTAAVLITAAPVAAMESDPVAAVVRTVAASTTALVVAAMELRTAAAPAAALALAPAATAIVPAPP